MFYLPTHSYTNSCNRSYYFDMFHYLNKETISKNLHTGNSLLSIQLNNYNSTLNRVLYKFLCLYKESYYKDENGMYTHQPRLYNFLEPYTVDCCKSRVVHSIHQSIRTYMCMSVRTRNLHIYRHYGTLLSYSSSNDIRYRYSYT